MTFNATDSLYDAATKLAVHRAGVELAMVAAIVANPSQGAVAASRAGFKAEIIEQDDLRIIVDALRVKLMLGRLTGECSADQLAVAQLASTGLKLFGFWDDTQIAGNLGSSRWSDESLAALFNRDLHHPNRIANLVLELRRIDYRQQEAAKSYARCRDLLENTQHDSDSFKPNVNALPAAPPLEYRRAG